MRVSLGARAATCMNSNQLTALTILLAACSRPGPRSGSAAVRLVDSVPWAVEFGMDLRLRSMLRVPFFPTCFADVAESRTSRRVSLQALAPNSSGRLSSRCWASHGRKS